MSKAFIARVIQQSVNVTGAAANRTTNELIYAVIKEICSFQATTFVLRIDRLTRLTRMCGAVPGSMDCR